MFKHVLPASQSALSAIGWISLAWVMTSHDTPMTVWICQLRPVDIFWQHKFLDMMWLMPASYGTEFSTGPCPQRIMRCRMEEMARYQTICVNVFDVRHVCRCRWLNLEDVFLLEKAAAQPLLDVHIWTSCLLRIFCSPTYSLTQTTHCTPRNILWEIL